MANHDHEFIRPDRVEEQHRAHARATGINQSGKAENLGDHGTVDATLNWNSGMHRDYQGRGDTTPFPDTAAGTFAETITATAPDNLGATLRPMPDGKGGALSGVDAIAGATPLHNPGVVRERR